MTTNGQPGLRWNPRAEAPLENPYSDPKDPRFIPAYVWDQLDLEGRMWVASRQEINALDVFHLRKHLDGLAATAGRLWIALFYSGAITAAVLLITAYTHR